MTMNGNEQYTSCSLVVAERPIAVSTGSLRVLTALFVVLLGMLSACQPTEPPAPPPPSNENLNPPDIEHRVSYSGETLALIASWYTGKATNWTAIRAANPGLKPERMNLGQVIMIPGHLVVERNPMPRRFIQDNLAKVKAKPRDDAGAPPTTDGGTTTPPTETTEKVDTAPATPPTDEVDLDALLKEQTEAQGSTPPAPREPTSPETNSAPTEASAPPPSEGTPPKNGDAEREQLLDELLK